MGVGKTFEQVAGVGLWEINLAGGFEWTRGERDGAFETNWEMGI